MSKHLKNKVIELLEESGFDFVALPKESTPHKRGVHYFYPPEAVQYVMGAMDKRKDGHACKKRIVVRPSRFRKGLHELYTFHFPKQWSAACVANRELIKEAQRQAHAVEKDHSIEALEWRVRFFNHYFTVVKGGAKPEEGMKAYTRFYQYTYVAIYRQLQAERKRAAEPEEISFEPVRMPRNVGADLVSVPLGSVPLGSVPLGSVPLVSVPLVSVPLVSVPLVSVPLGSVNGGFFSERKRVTPLQYRHAKTPPRPSPQGEGEKKCSNTCIFQKKVVSLQPNWKS